MIVLIVLTLFYQLNTETNTSNITACIILHRSDKQPDRVEISPEQLCEASTYAEQLAKELEKPMQVLGWYHSHPHITVWPSHVGKKSKSFQFAYSTLINFRFAYPSNLSDIRSIICWTYIFCLWKRE